MYYRQLLLILFVTAREAAAACQSYGTDFVDGGGPYCINATSSDFFSFGTEFAGCQSSDSQGDITPILIDPNTNEFFCSDIATQPEGTNMVSVCNVSGQELQKMNMVTGSYIVVLEGLTFAWMRSFDLNVAPPVVITLTPTATSTLTTTPVIRVIETTTLVELTTVPPITVTVPSSVNTITAVITPPPVTVVITKIFTRTTFDHKFWTTTSTTTQAEKCPSRHVPDAPATITPVKAKYLPYLGKAPGQPQPWVRALPRKAGRYQRDPAWANSVREQARVAGLLQARAADSCTTSSLQTTETVSVTTTLTASTETVTETIAITTTSTVIPQPTTVYLGQATLTITSTTTARTVTRFHIGFTCTKIVNTTAPAITSTLNFVPPGACLNVV